MRELWGIDLGGTKIEGVVLQDRSDDNMNRSPVLGRLRIPTEQEGGYEHILLQINKLVGSLSKETGRKPEVLGIGTPGCLDPKTQLLKNSNTTCLNQRPLKKDLERVLGIPVRIANDANCFTLAEARIGAVPERIKDAEVVFGIIMGTGVGGGIAVRGQLIHGCHGIGGEWGHNFLDSSGGPCYCGKIGCVETVISGPALEKHYAFLSGKNLGLSEIIKRHEQSADAFATQTVQRLAQFFGKAVASVINIIDPEAIVIGGGLGNIDLLYDDGVEEVKKHIFNDELHSLFMRPKLGDSAGVFGAAWLSA